mmetsp:Transcript_41533/g.93666  ORF Transcript_41533/g.93666 Transcript_41533/m.93666 type:complete len:204 (+) Transcript_41533:688-1299(+)
MLNLIKSVMNSFMDSPPSAPASKSSCVVKSLFARAKMRRQLPLMHAIFLVSISPASSAVNMFRSALACTILLRASNCSALCGFPSRRDSILSPAIAGPKVVMNSLNSTVPLPSESRALNTRVKQPWVTVMLRDSRNFRNSYLSSAPEWSRSIRLNAFFTLVDCIPSFSARHRRSWSSSLMISPPSTWRCCRLSVATRRWTSRR